MSGNAIDLGALSRVRVAGATAGEAGAPAAETRVPRPRPRWTSRVLLPAGLLAATAGLLAYGARDALRPATPVRVVPVVVRQATAPVDGSSPVPSGAPSAATVQAPGWVEPDPFAVSVSALTDGVAKEVLVLEGQRVKAGQVVLRMVDDDAKLALARA